MISHVLRAPSTAVVTILGSNYLARASLLEASIARHEPTWDFYALLVDLDDASLVGPAGISRVLTPEDLSMDSVDLAAMSLFYNITEFSTALKPFALRHLLDRGYDRVYYIDPDVEFFGPLTESHLLLDTHDVVLTPHTLAPIPDDGREPSQDQIRASGSFNLGFFAGTAGCRDLLDWWADCLTWGSGIETQNNLFTDQRWMDFAPSYAVTGVLRHPGYNVAYWNMHERRVSGEAGKYLVNSQELRFLHYSGYDPAQPWTLAKYIANRPRIRLTDSRTIADLFDSYGERLISWSLRNGRRTILDRPYTRNQSPTLGSIEQHYAVTLRHQLHNEKVQTGTSLSLMPGETGMEAVERWLLIPMPGAGPRSLPRLIQLIWASRPDLQSAFPDPVEFDRANFIRWWSDTGSGEHKLPRYLLDEGLADRLGLVSLVGPQPSSEGDARPRSAQPVVNVIGYLDSESGVGEAGRRLANALEEGPFDVRRFSSRQSLSRKVNTDVASHPGDGLTILAVNADQLEAVEAEFVASLAKVRPRVGYWWWELEEVPGYFERVAERLDEVWAPTEFIFRNLRPRLGDRVQLAPLLIGEPPKTTGTTREDFGLPQDVCLFLVRFDFLSSMERKNPKGAIKAFRKAFPREGDAFLLIKTTNGDRAPQLLDALAWSVRDRKDIRVWDASLDESQNSDLTSCSDCYVSLHRSEGLGFNLVEAMSLGVPVITTAYGGNMDFCNDSNALLTSFRMVPVTDSSGLYASGGVWADADIGDAARFMTMAASGSDVVAELAAQARDDMAELRDVGPFLEFVSRRASALKRKATTPAHHNTATWEVRQQSSGSDLSADLRLPDVVSFIMEPTSLHASQSYLELTPVEAVLATGKQGWFRRKVRYVIFKLTESNLWYARRLVEDLASQQRVVHVMAQPISVRTEVGTAVESEAGGLTNANEGRAMLSTRPARQAGSRRLIDKRGDRPAKAGIETSYRQRPARAAVISVGEETLEAFPLDSGAS